MARGTEGFYMEGGKRQDAKFHADGEDYVLDAEEQAAGIARMREAGVSEDLIANWYKGPSKLQLAMGEEFKG